MRKAAVSLRTNTGSIILYQGVIRRVPLLRFLFGMKAREKRTLQVSHWWETAKQRTQAFLSLRDGEQDESGHRWPEHPEKAGQIGGELVVEICLIPLQRLIRICTQNQGCPRPCLNKRAIWRVARSP